ncbi:MAG: PEGA domain-containing protein [Polyangiaceae bacterium]|jgi:hypothetical protein|nr:PEGA domain-containing protein [Polyangiaceae bacterium]
MIQASALAAEITAVTPTSAKLAVKMTAVTPTRVILTVKQIATFKVGKHDSVSCGTMASVEGPSGSLYVDGDYTGEKTPTGLDLPPGNHRVAVGTDDDRYLLIEVQVSEDREPCTLTLKPENRLLPTEYKALYVDIHSISADACDVHASNEELDAIFDLFMHNLKELWEPYSYRTIAWTVKRERTQGTIGGGGWSDVRPAIGPVGYDEYDVVFWGWKTSGRDCQVAGGGGLAAWQGDLAGGTSTFRFDSTDVVEQVAWFFSADPGPFVHESLHIAEFSFLGERAGIDGATMGVDFFLHQAEKYGYEYPWLEWYRHHIRGQVAGSDGVWLGLRPELLNSCTIRAGRDACDW